MPNPLRFDPTRTATLRRQLMSDLRKRFYNLKLAARKLVVEQDAFALNAFCPTGPGGGVDPSCSPGGSTSSSFAADDKSLEVRGYTIGTDVTTKGTVARLEKLTSDEKGALREWVEDSDDLQETLREGDTQAFMFLKKDLDSAIAKGQLKKDTVLYRGESGGHLRNLKAGQELTDPAYTTTSVDPVVAKSASGGRAGNAAPISAEFAIKAPKSSTALDVRASSLAEVLLPRDTKIRIDKITSKKYGDHEHLFVEASLVSGLTANARFYMLQSQEQLEAFRRWMRTQFSEQLTDRELWRKYAQAAMQKGMGRAFDDVNRGRRTQANLQEQMDVYRGSKEQFLRSSFNQPVAAEKLEYLAGRSYDYMEGVSEETSERMSQKLASGLAEGKSSSEIADEFEDELGIASRKAERIARTEIVRAHSEGQLMALEDMGVTQLGVSVEWSTAGDDKVCPLCEAMEGVVLKVEEARDADGNSILPLHPNCRCAWLPAGVGEDDSDQVKSPKAVSKAKRKAGLDDDDEEPVANSWLRILNAFCATGPGGGVDPTCSPGGQIAASKEYAALGAKVDKANAGKYQVLASQGLTKDAITAKAQAFADSHDVYVRVPSHVVDQILADGRIKTQHETGQSSGVVAIKTRIKGEAEGQGVPVNTPAAERPVSAYLSQGPHSGESAARYGDVAIKLKDSVRERSTVTFGDSLEMSSNAYGQASPLKAVSYRSVDPQELLRNSKLLDSSKEYHSQKSFAEVQVHKGVKLSDIESVHFQTQPSDRTVKLLADKGIKWSMQGATTNAFCPTGPGGGVDPTCSPGGSSSSADVRSKLEASKAFGTAKLDKLMHMNPNGPVDGEFQVHKTMSKEQISALQDALPEGTRLRVVDTAKLMAEVKKQAMPPPPLPKRDTPGQAEWERDLSSNERKAVEAWSKGNPAELRAAMAGAKNVPERTKQQAADLKAAMDKAPNYVGTTYRGMQSRDPANLARFTEVGSTVTVRGLTSASKDIETAASSLSAKPEAAQLHQLMLEIRGKTGVDISRVAAPSFKHQREVVVRPGTQYRVVSSEQREVDRHKFDFNLREPFKPAAETIAKYKIEPVRKLNVTHVVLEEI